MKVSSGVLALLAASCATTINVVHGSVTKKTNRKKDPPADSKLGEDEQNDEVNEDVCTMWLASSSTSTVDEPKWGLYAGIEFGRGKTLGNAELAVQTFNLAGHAGEREDFEKEPEDLPYRALVVDFLEQYMWTPDSSGGQFESVGRVVTNVAGAGVLGGWNPTLINSDWNQSASYFRRDVYDDAGVAHPGRGAYSTYYNVTLSALENIVPGSEIFLDYGGNYEEDKKDFEGDLTKSDYEKIDLVIKRIINFMDKYKEEMTPEAKQDIYSFLVKDVLKAAAGPEKGANAVALLPQDPDELPDVIAAGGSLPYSKEDGFRTLDWLEENGLCMDLIHPEKSTIPHAGQGAFATRPISKGSLVSPIPLVHLADSSIYDMHELESDEDPDGDLFYYRASEPVIGKQLIYNYVLGHPESSVTFLPAGSASTYINHSPEPNAKLVWSEHPNHDSDFFSTPPEQLLEENRIHIGLMMEVVAIKDIAKDEEVFIDYGPEWAKAWEEHAAKWNKKVEDGDIDPVWSLSALNLNEQYREKAFKTPEELEDDPYPENVQLKCYVVVADDEEPAEGQLHQWSAPDKGTVYDGENLFDCTVLERGKDDYDNLWYKIEWQDGPVDEDDDEESTEYIVDNVPHRAFLFTDRLGTSDMHVEDPFRHYIGIPDEIFPQGPWRNNAAS